MRRFASLVLLLILGAPASSSAQNCDVFSCPPVNGQEQSVYYYSLWNASPNFTMRYKYINTLVTGAINFLDGSGFHHRIVHEYRLPLVITHCQLGHAQFEANVLNVSVGTNLAGELFALFQPGTVNRVGTVFIDNPINGNRAISGTIGAQKYYDCTPKSGQPLVLRQNIAMFHPGLDTAAIDGATLDEIQTEWLDHIQPALEDAALQHVLQRPACSEIPVEDYTNLINAGATCVIEYDDGDPTPEMWGIPPS